MYKEHELNAESPDHILSSGLKKHDVLTAPPRVLSFHRCLSREMSMEHRSAYYFSTLDGNE
jgi:hypothetical protein